MMTDFITGFVFAAILFGLPRVFFGTFHIWNLHEGWILEWRTMQAHEHKMFEMGRRSVKSATFGAGETEPPCSFKTELIYDTCTTCDVDDVKACKNPIGGSE